MFNRKYSCIGCGRGRPPQSSGHKKHSQVNTEYEEKEHLLYSARPKGLTPRYRFAELKTFEQNQTGTWANVHHKDWVQGSNEQILRIWKWDYNGCFGS